VVYLPVRPSSPLFAFARALRFSAFAVCLGSSYFQRLIARIPNLGAAVRANAGYAEYVAALDAMTSAPGSSNGGGGGCDGNGGGGGGGASAAGGPGGSASSYASALSVSAASGSAGGAGGGGGGGETPAGPGAERPAPDHTLQAIQLTCVSLAAKVVDALPACDVLRYMLSKVRAAPPSEPRLWGRSSVFSLGGGAALLHARWPAPLAP